MSEKNLSPKSDMRIRKMLCLHQMFRRKPHVVFNHPEGKLWDDYVNALCEVRDDADLNMDYQWEGKLGDKEQYIVRADGLKGEVRPGNPRLEEACHMASLRPSIQDMEQGTDIFHNAVKEYPTLLHREALLKACCEIYVAIDRDLYFFIGAVDKYYGTNYVKDAMSLIINTKKEDKAYCAAEAYVETIEKDGLSGARQDILDQELESYSSFVRMNRFLKPADRIKEYKGMDISWADKRDPSETFIKNKFAEGLQTLLAEAAVSTALKGDGHRYYEALLDKVDRMDAVSKKDVLLLHTADILYGFGYANAMEGKYDDYVKEAVQYKQSVSLKPAKKVDSYEKEAHSL